MQQTLFGITYQVGSGMDDETRMRRIAAPTLEVALRKWRTWAEEGPSSVEALHVQRVA